jgi:hypothetical protein
MGHIIHNGYHSSQQSDFNYQNFDIKNIQKKIDPSIPIEERSNE